MIEFNRINTLIFNRLFLINKAPTPLNQKTFNLSLNLNTFYSLFLSNQLPGIELNYFYNSSLSSTYNCTKRQKSYYQEDFDKAETFNDIVYFQDEEKNLNFSFNFLLIDGLGYGVPNEYYAPGMILQKACGKMPLSMFLMALCTSSFAALTPLIIYLLSVISSILLTICPFRARTPKRRRPATEASQDRSSRQRHIGHPCA